MRSLEYDGRRIEYEVRLLAARRTLGIEVHPEGRVLVRAPAGCSDEVIAAVVRKRAAWIRRQLAEFGRYQPRTPPRRYVSGESHWYLGRQYRLKIASGSAPSVTLTRGQIVVRLTGSLRPERVRARLLDWYRERARSHFESVLADLLPQFRDARKPRLVVRAMNSRWGSLSSAGTMSLNLSLVRAPKACIEYVIAHELCHLIHRNHDPAFFALLRRVIPDWPERKRQLEQLL